METKATVQHKLTVEWINYDAVRAAVLDNAQADTRHE